MIAIEILTLCVLAVLGYLFTHRAIPWIVVRVGRLFGAHMKMNPLTERRVRRFRSIRRGYWCFVIITTAFVMSLFLELMVNRKPLMLRWGDHTQYPAVADWADTWIPFADPVSVARANDFGLEGDTEVPYRTYARWVRDPSSLEQDAVALAREIETDEKRFRDKMAEIAEQKGEDYSRESPLPDYKVEEYDKMRAEADALRALRPAFEEGKAGILPALYPYSPGEQLLTELDGPPPHSGFTAGHPLFGTDFEGKDVLSQLLYGFRLSFAFAMTVAIIGYTIGVAVGAIMGYFGGWTDIILQRIVEIWSSIPFLYTMMIIASITHPNFIILALMLIVLRSWIGITYTIRGEYYREKARDYVQAARAIGVRRAKIMGRHIFPNALVPVVTFMPFGIVAYIYSLVSLDFLGFGLPPGTPSWGALLQQGNANVQNYPELVLYPIAAFSLTLFAVVMIGEAVREAFDPKKYSRLR